MACDFHVEGLRSERAGTNSLLKTRRIASVHNAELEGPDLGVWQIPMSCLSYTAALDGIVEGFFPHFPNCFFFE